CAAVGCGLIVSPCSAPGGGGSGLFPAPFTATAAGGATGAPGSPKLGPAADGCAARLEAAETLLVGTRTLTGLELQRWTTGFGAQCPASSGPRPRTTRSAIASRISVPAAHSSTIGRCMSGGRGPELGGKRGDALGRSSGFRPATSSNETGLKERRAASAGA